MELFVPGFEGKRKKSTRPAMRVLTAGTGRACIHGLMPARSLSKRPVNRHPIYTSYTCEQYAPNFSRVHDFYLPRRRTTYKKVIKLFPTQYRIKPDGRL